MDPAGTQLALEDLKARAGTQDHVLLGHTHLLEQDFTVASLKTQRFPLSKSPTHFPRMCYPSLQTGHLQQYSCPFVGF